jgi:hypothetical protein
MVTRLLKASWLRRVIEVSTPQGLAVVEYNGRGIGYESVLIDGKVARRVWSGPWFVPHFDFEVLGRPASVDVRVWPWLGIRDLVLQIDGKAIYAEGRHPHGDSKPLSLGGSDDLA